MVSVRTRRTRQTKQTKAPRKKKFKKSKKLNFGNQIIADQWDDSLTTAQNYRALGLAQRLSRSTGGTEKSLKVVKPKAVDSDFSISDLSSSSEEEPEEEEPEENQSTDPADIVEGTAKIIRDKDGNVEKVIYGTKKLYRPDSEAVKRLKQQAALKKKKQHVLNEMDLQMVEELHARYGTDFAKMKWDIELNPYQHSEGQLKKMFKLWKENDQVQA